MRCIPDYDLVKAAALIEDLADLQRTWDDGIHICPPQSRLASVAQRPVCLHLHGGFGFSECEEILTCLCTQLNMGLVAPNSFARRLRHPNIAPDSLDTGSFPLADLYRRAELLFAYQQLHSLEWVDQSRIILSGFSEGGAAVALWGGATNCCAALITSWSCSAPTHWAWANGLRIPETTPTLVLMAEHDPWFDRNGWRPHLNLYQGEHRCVIVPGTDMHDIFKMEEVQTEYLMFLKKLINKKGSVVDNA